MDSKIKNVSTPFNIEAVEGLKAGDRVLISGKIYSARDAAHKRIFDTVKSGGQPPIDLKNQIIYYAGPCPAKPGHVSGPFGPTTSGRMDKYAPFFIEMGLKGMIGKGERTQVVIDTMKREKAIYFAAIGGLGATIATKIKSMKIVAYEDLGAEAIYELIVEDFPAIVAIDSFGNNLYESEPSKYKNKLG